MAAFRCPAALYYDYHAEAALQVFEDREEAPPDYFVRIVPYADDDDDDEEDEPVSLVGGENGRATQDAPIAADDPWMQETTITDEDVGSVRIVENEWLDRSIFLTHTNFRSLTDVERRRYGGRRDRC